MALNLHFEIDKDTAQLFLLHAFVKNWNLTPFWCFRFPLVLNNSISRHSAIRWNVYKIFRNEICQDFCICGTLAKGQLVQSDSEAEAACVNDREVPKRRLAPVTTLTLFILIQMCLYCGCHFILLLLWLQWFFYTVEMIGSRQLVWSLEFLIVWNLWLKINNVDPSSWFWVWFLFCFLLFSIIKKSMCNASVLHGNMLSQSFFRLHKRLVL